MKSVCLFMLVTATALCAAAQAGHQDAQLTDVSVPQPQYQVIPAAQLAQIGAQQQAVTDIQTKLNDIQGDIKDIKADVETLKKTDWVFGFIVRMTEILVPVALCTVLGVWLTKVWNPKRRRRRPNRPASVSLG